MRIGKRLSIGYGTIFVFLLVLAFLLEFTLARLNKYRDKVELAHKNIEVVRELDKTLCRQAKELMDMILTGSKEELIEFNEYTEKAGECLDLWQVFIEQEAREDKHGILDKIRYQYNIIITLAGPQIKIVQPQELAELGEELEDRFDDELLPLIQKAIDIEKVDMYSAESSARHAHYLAISMVGGIILCSLITVGLLSVTITRSITRPLSKLKAAVEQVKKGNVDIEVDVNSGDEIESLAIAFNNMTRDLKKSMVTIDSLNLEIARREKLEIQLQNTNDDLRDFAYVASHHMREPLRKIRAFGNLLSDALSGKLSAEDKENLEFMIQGAQRMDEVVSSLLKYSRIENRILRLRSVSIRKVVEDLLDGELTDINQAVDVSVEISPELPAIRADENMLREVMYHLISNSYKYRQKDVPLHISINAEAADNEQVRILVQDNGIGLNETYHKDIFKMFQKVVAEDSRHGPGIGLALCKKILSKHGGDIGVSSSQGQGSTFWFTMPAAHEPAVTVNTALMS